MSARPTASRPSRDEFVALARDHTVVPVWREVLADLETPVSAFVKLVRRRRAGFLLESVEHAERWGRFSFIGRDPALTLVVRGQRVEFDGTPPPGVPTDAGALAALEALLARVPRAAASPSCRRSTAASSATSATTSCARSSACPTCRPTTSGMPDAVLSLTGHVTAFDHFRQRLYLIENVFLDRPAPTTRLRDAYDDARRRGSTRASTSWRARCRTCRRRRRPSELTELPDVHTSTMAGACTTRAVEAAREHILAGDIFQVVLAQRFDLDGHYDPFDVYRVLRQVNPSPYMYFVRHPEATLVGSSPEPMVQLLDGRVDQPADRGHPAPRPHRGARPAHGRRAHRAPEGAGRARDARRPRPQRRRPGREVRHRAGRRADDARALLPRDAPHEPGRRRARRRAQTRSTCCGPRSRPAP